MIVDKKSAMFCQFLIKKMIKNIVGATVVFRPHGFNIYRNAAPPQKYLGERRSPPPRSPPLQTWLYGYRSLKVIQTGTMTME